MRKVGDFIKLPDSELEVMQVIWDMYRESCPEISAAEMFRFSPALSRLKLTTVLTLITRLVEKGFITAEKVGRRSCYTPIIQETDYKNVATQDFLSVMYKNQASGLISALIGTDSLEKEDLIALRRLIDETEKESDAR